MAKPAPPTLQDFDDKPLAGWRLRLYTIIFEADTPAGRLFDKALIVLILVSIAVVMADSVQAIHGGAQQLSGRRADLAGRPRGPVPLGYGRTWWKMARI